MTKTFRHLGRAATRAAFASVFWLTEAAGSGAAEPRFAQQGTHRYADLSIEELMDESITSVSKTEQKISEAPAAVYVITGEDIRRSGVTSIPEAVRRAPGLNVAQINAHTWAISARGFNNEFADKMLVLVDGRTVYDPSFSGVYWDVQDMMLDDLDRIEVIRGPGATLWGANAVNGVINITTKKAKDTQGVLMVTGAGTQQYSGAVRYGGRVNDESFYRVYLKYDDYDGVLNSAGHNIDDEWNKLQGGFRLDWEPTERDVLTLQGDLHHRRLDQEIPTTLLRPPFQIINTEQVDAYGGNVLGRWTHVFSEHSDFLVQGYYDRIERLNKVLDVRRDTYDIELQNRVELGSRHEIIWGANYRYTKARYDDSFFLSYAKDSDDGHLFGGFVQDSIWLVHDHLRLTLGSKFEQIYHDDLEVQPSARLLWTPNESHSVWTSVSRAARTANFNEHRLRVNPTSFPGPPGQPVRLVSVLPGDDLNSETVLAYELGYRLQPRPNLFLDLAAFYNSYDDLIANEVLAPFLETEPAPPHWTLASRKANGMEGETYGIEIAPAWSVTERWRLSGGYSFLQMDLHSGLPNRAGELEEGHSPQHQFHLHSSFNLPHNVMLDSALYYVDRLAAKPVPSYLRLDLHLAWRPTDNLELSLSALNLLDPQHPECVSESGTPVEVPRSIFGKLTWRF